MADPAIRRKLEAGEFFMAPGAYDMLTALLINRIGFDCVYAPGFWMMASYLGIPDAGIATYTDMLQRISRLVEVSDAPVIADADTGYGGLLNVHHTVRGYEDAGVTGVQIEDQEFPKKCGHTPGKRLVTVGEMRDRLKVALDARRDENLLIVARTDARKGEGFQETMHRAHAFAEEGVDLIFLEGLESREEMVASCKQLDTPILLNMVEGGDTPILSAAELAEMGVACAIYPAMSPLHALAAIDGALRNLNDTGHTPAPDASVFNFRDACKLIGFEEVWAFDEKWARPAKRGQA
jgi:2-methylisocitrate lyase-like PEP mutase family enzyme